MEIFGDHGLSVFPSFIFVSFGKTENFTKFDNAFMRGPTKWVFLFAWTIRFDDFYEKNF